MFQKGGSVYILTNSKKTVLYTGVTSDLGKRLREHISKKYPVSFTARYNCNLLIYYQNFPTIVEAIDEEKRIKKLSRNGKERLIDTLNPERKILNDKVLAW